MENIHTNNITSHCLLVSMLHVVMAYHIHVYCVKFMYTYISISYTYLFTELWLISLFGLFTYQYIDPQARVHCVFICLLFQVFSDFVA